MGNDLPRQKIVRCIICDFEIALNEKQFDQCPNCGTKHLPCDPDDDVTIKINWHELRILTIWAERFEQKCLQNNKSFNRYIYAITNRLEIQFPNNLQLTLADKTQALKNNPSKRCSEILTNIPEVE